MSRIFVTGDTHGLHDFSKLSKTNFKERNELTKDDYLIIAGDFGGVWNGIIDIREVEKENNCDINWQKSPLVDMDNHTLKQYQELPCTVLFVDGNHENFNALNKYEVKEWNGGKVHFIRDDIIHLMRGQVFEIAGKKFFTMGGANSIDKMYRKKDVSWWEEEMPTMEECYAASETLDKHNWEVDYVITHAAPDNILYQISPTFQHDLITNYLFSIDKSLKFKHWYFGHYHIDEDFERDGEEKYHCLYQRVIEII